MVSTLTAIEQRQGNALRLHGEGEFPVEAVAQFLLSLEYAYNSAYVLDSILDQASGLLETGRQYPGRIPPWMSWWPPTPEKVAAMVPEADRLILQGVELHSPGMWDFLGKLNPLETLRLYLNDRHERQKDRQYRSPAEARKLEIENEARSLDNLERQIQILKDLGATDQQLAVLIEQLVFMSFRGLNGAQDQGLLLNAEVIELDVVKKRSPRR